MFWFFLITQKCLVMCIGFGNMVEIERQAMRMCQERQMEVRSSGVSYSSWKAIENLGGAKGNVFLAYQVRGGAQPLRQCRPLNVKGVHAPLRREFVPLHVKIMIVMCR